MSRKITDLVFIVGFNQVRTTEVYGKNYSYENQVSDSWGYENSHTYYNLETPQIAPGVAVISGFQLAHKNEASQFLFEEMGKEIFESALQYGNVNSFRTQQVKNGQFLTKNLTLSDDLRLQFLNQEAITLSINQALEWEIPNTDTLYERQTDHQAVRELLTQIEDKDLKGFEFDEEDAMIKCLANLLMYGNYRNVTKAHDRGSEEISRIEGRHALLGMNLHNGTYVIPVYMEELLHLEQWEKVNRETLPYLPLYGQRTNLLQFGQDSYTTTNHTDLRNMFVNYLFQDKFKATYLNPRDFQTNVYIQSLIQAYITPPPRVQTQEENIPTYEELLAQGKVQVYNPPQALSMDQLQQVEIPKREIRTSVRLEDISLFDFLEDDQGGEDE